MTIQRQKNTNVSTGTYPLLINYGSNLNFIELKGKSVSDQVHDRYRKLLVTLDRLLLSEPSMIVSINLEMLNGTSVKYLLSVIKRLNKAAKLGKKVQIFWKVNTEEKDELTELAMDLSLICNFEFKIITEEISIDPRLVENTNVVDQSKTLLNESRHCSRFAA